jgi:hypothetical protein
MSRPKRVQLAIVDHLSYDVFNYVDFGTYDSSIYKQANRIKRPMILQASNVMD